MTARLLVQVMRDPAAASRLSPDDWRALLAAARAEQMIGNLAARLRGQPVPDDVSSILADALSEAEIGHRRALWEADRAAQALAPLGVPVILLKGTAFVAAGLTAGEGRSIGDLDILVPRDRIDAVEQALFSVGWEWVKQDSYDDLYYRQWMHELPPMIHRERDRMIDVHHTILPLTARPTPDALALIDAAIPLSSGLSILSPDDMLCHAAAHLFADGDLSGGLRNLWDIRCLWEQSYTAEQDRQRLESRARHHDLLVPMRRALALSAALYGSGPAARLSLFDRLIRRRLLARDAWGRETHKLLRSAFFIRSHWLRMPSLMLARHLWTKWRKGHRPA